MNWICVGKCGRPLVSQYHEVPKGYAEHRGRNMCGPDYDAARRDGVLDDYERIARTRDEVLDDWVVLRKRGLSLTEAAARMGMTYDGLEQALRRARLDNDPRALYVTGQQTFAQRCAAILAAGRVATAEAPSRYGRVVSIVRDRRGEGAEIVWPGNCATTWHPLRDLVPARAGAR